ncbi:glycosyltransferase family 2 protein [Escherichia albertii]|uniref:Glycosyltransferase family 2 protein n=1 Tax=Escherichia albertii TaxID=208962 RepID=A0A5A4U9P0_ESCAL|nr:glycosyltransferase family 2 protein [Escherichia albertii]BBM62733.1 glycosyltransferase family 2 protein [Escherichia albertii]
MKEDNVYIVVLNWENALETIKCLSSLFALEYDNYRIVVCDNNSQDSSVAEIINWIENKNINLQVLTEEDIDDFDRLRDNKIYIIKNNKNYGYAGGNNVGIKFALNDKTIKYIWILNNDTTVSPTALYSLCKKMHNHPNLGICGSLLLHQNNKSIIQAAGGVFNKVFCTTKHLYENVQWLELSESEKEHLNPDYIVGASMFIDKKVFETEGLLFEDYFLYYEEIDFCLRVRDKYKISVDFNSHVYHKLGDSIKKGKSELADYLSIRNRLIIARRFFPISFLTVWLSLFVVMFNRIKRMQFSRAFKVLKVIFIDSWEILLKYKTV